MTEGGNTDTYQILLNTKPTANVTIDLQLDGQTTTDKTSLVFTPQNWSTPQTVTVTAVDDAIAESFHTSTIGHTISTTAAAYRTESGIRTHLFCALQAFNQLQTMRVEGLIDNLYQVSRQLFIPVIRQFITENLPQAFAR